MCLGVHRASANFNKVPLRPPSTCLPQKSHTRSKVVPRALCLTVADASPNTSRLLFSNGKKKKTLVVPRKHKCFELSCETIPNFQIKSVKRRCNAECFKYLMIVSCMNKLSLSTTQLQCCRYYFNHQTQLIFHYNYFIRDS